MAYSSDAILRGENRVDELAVVRTASSSTRFNRRRCVERQAKGRGD